MDALDKLISMKKKPILWRVPIALRSKLEGAVGQRNRRVSQIITMAVKQWLYRNVREIPDEAEQRRLPAIAERLIGVASSGPGSDKHAVRAAFEEHFAKKRGLRV